MPDHQEQSATALAHGAAQCDDIERVRRDVDAAEASVARADPTVRSAVAVASAAVTARRHATRTRSPDPQPQLTPAPAMGRGRVRDNRSRPDGGACRS